MVEAQGRGRLHIHMIIWLKHGLSPMELKERCSRDSVFAQRVLQWYDDVFSQSLPAGTHQYQRDKHMYKRQPVMSRPLHPQKDTAFEQKFAQDLRDVLENTGQIHVHNDTCFKHLPKISSYFAMMIKTAASSFPDL